MEMDKNKWIDEVLESTKQVQDIEPNPFLFEKITQRIEQGKIETGSLQGSRSNVKWAFASITALILVVNTFGIAKSLQSRMTSSAANQVQTSSDFNQELGYTTVYSY